MCWRCWSPSVNDLSTLLTGLGGLIQRIIREDQPESTKRALALLAGVVLCLCAFGLTLAIEWQACSGKPVDGGLVTVAIAAYGILATLAGVAYRKPEDGPNG